MCGIQSQFGLYVSHTEWPFALLKWSDTDQKVLFSSPGSPCRSNFGSVDCQFELNEWDWVFLEFAFWLLFFVYFSPHTAQFQITVLVRFGSVWFWLVTVLLIVWPRSLLLYPFRFHKKLRIWWKKFFSFRQADNLRFSCFMYCYTYRQLTCENLQVSEFSFLRKSTKKKSLVIRTWDFP